MKWKLLLLALLAASALRAQPGPSGGGLSVRQLYGRGESGQLVPLTWAAAQPRVFEPGPGRPRNGSPIGVENYQPDFQRLWPGRLLLVYRADTMVLDLTDLPGPSISGQKLRLDSLVVAPGYFRYADTVRTLCQGWRGLTSPPSREIPGSFTPHTLARLRACGQLTYEPRARLDFLAPGQLPAIYYWALSRHWLGQQRPDSALAALGQAEARDPDLRQRPAVVLLRARALRQQGHDAAATAWTSRAIGLVWHWYRAHPGPAPAGVPERLAAEAYSYLGVLKEAYALRRQLYLRQQRPRAALADFDTLRALERDDDRHLRPHLDKLADTLTVERFFFLAGHLHRRGAYAGAARLLRARLPPATRPEWNCDLGHQLQRYGYDYADDYFLLATAEYHLGQHPAAYAHWLRSAMRRLCLACDLTRYQAQLDSLWQQHPTEPRLLLARGIVRLAADELAPDYQARLQAGLRDIDQAGQLGYAGFELHYYRALGLSSLGRFVEARQQLDLAIAKNPTAPELFLVRRRVRQDLHEPASVIQADDHTYHRLCPR